MPEPEAPSADTKICESCDKTIGKSETKCPACGVDFEELEDAVVSVEKAQSILEKRRKAKEPKPCTKCNKVHEGECSTPPAAKKSRFSGLGNVLRKGKS